MEQKLLKSLIKWLNNQKIKTLVRKTLSKHRSLKQFQTLDYYDLANDYVTSFIFDFEERTIKDLSSMKLNKRNNIHRIINLFEQNNIEQSASQNKLQIQYYQFHNYTLNNRNTKVTKKIIQKAQRYIICEFLSHFFDLLVKELKKETTKEMTNNVYLYEF
ncbi:hypothetical protein [Mycoplasmopsis pullorum]|uniref:Uncharacterized protein n=1 Tax=Mycoplasmopsis pullorum TaxID=48003 RepID=A0A1L4FSX5_9BACT|nr:hypothetical protein [Mycoplasmopsis pullorum]APJ38682.1 hypothetical protein BLA55_03410 [Mycoplasmopsis pullorum]